MAKEIIKVSIEKLEDNDMRSINVSISADDITEVAAGTTALVLQISQMLNVSVNEVIALIKEGCLEFQPNVKCSASENE